MSNTSSMELPAGTVVNLENRIGTSRVRVVTGDGTEITFTSIKGSVTSIKASGTVTYNIEELILVGIDPAIDESNS